LPHVDSGDAGQPPPSSALPAAMSLHMPRAVPSAQVLQTPAQSFSQQTPSTQNPDRHSSRSLQLAPFSLRPHVPIWHWPPGMHWLLSVHDVKHAVPPGLHTNGVHGDVAPGVHTPEALQLEAAVEVPFTQVAAAHMVPAGYLRQPPMPLQKPSLPQLAGPWSGQRPAGSGPPLGTAVHVPLLPSSAHEKQLAVHALPQHTPCAQNPDEHSSARAHTDPFGRLPQEPCWQMLGGAHMSLVEQLVPHRLPLQRKGAQAMGAGAVQVPLWQTASPVKRLVVASQEPVRHTVPVG
jgi:hypothetical protein